MRYCLHPKCSVLVARGFCKRHEPFTEATRPQPWVRKWYHSPRWRAVRAWKLAQSPMCEACDDARRPPERASDVDHIQPHRGRADLFWNAANLQSLCHACHSRKTRGEQVARARRP